MIGGFHARIFAIWSLIPNRRAQRDPENSLTICAVADGDKMESIMKFVSYKINAPRETVLSNLKDGERILAAEKFDTSRGKPKMLFREKGERLKIKCERVEGPTRDNGFLEGTYFIGKLRESEGGTAIRGLILTAPIYHLVLIAFLVLSVVYCINAGGISPIPLMVLIFDVFMFYSEFKKQSVIKRYILRAFKNTYQDARENADREKRRAVREARLAEAVSSADGTAEGGVEVNLNDSE